MSKIIYTKKGTAVLKLPTTLSFKNRNIVDFNTYLSIFDWNIVNIIENLKKRKEKYIAFFLKCWR